MPDAPTHVEQGTNEPEVPPTGPAPGPSPSLLTATNLIAGSMLALALVRVVALWESGDVKAAFDEKTMAAPLLAGLLLQLPRLKVFKGLGVEAELVDAVARQVTKEVNKELEPKLEASEKRAEAIVNNTMLNTNGPDAPDTGVGTGADRGRAPKLGAPLGAGTPRAELSQLLAGLPSPGDGKSKDRYDWAKGRFNGKPQASGRRLVAGFEPPTDDRWLSISLSVESTDGRPLSGRVIFFVHDSFPSYRYEQTPGSDGRATRRLRSYGAFTAGAVCIDEEGQPTLELDLVEGLSNAPKWFLER